MKSIKIQVVNRHGIHCRPSSVIVKEMMPFKSQLLVQGASGKADPRRILDLITLGLKCGDTATLSANGEDEAAAILRLETLFKTEFDVPKS